jgi:exosortase C (VPDSG-CTERM-specific)
MSNQVNVGAGTEPSGSPAPVRLPESVPSEAWRIYGGAAAALLILAVFWRTIWAGFQLALNSQVYSYILVVPMVSIYLAVLRRRELPKRMKTSWIPASMALMAALFIGVVARRPETFQMTVSSGDVLALDLVSCFGFMLGVALLFLGRGVVWALGFPIFFLLAAVPLPEAWLNQLENWLKLASAEAAAWFFTLFRLPALREGVVFQLPGAVIEVAQECSGIRSSLVLLLTGLIASNLFLQSGWRRAVLIFAVIPMGILRNGFRVYVIGWLCSTYGPQMAQSAIHTRGGPLFFALSLLPLAGLLWWLYRNEQARPRNGNGEANFSAASGITP